MSLCLKLFQKAQRRAKKAPEMHFFPNCSHFNCASLKDNFLVCQDPDGALLRIILMDLGFRNERFL